MTFMQRLKALPWRQIFTALKGLLAAGGPAVLLIQQTLGYPPGEAEKIVAGLAALVGLILLVMDQSGTAVGKAAATVPGVQVHVDTTQESAAPEGLKAAARSDLPDVVPMRGGPREDANKGEKP
jgi:hypothetical protein